MSDKEKMMALINEIREEAIKDFAEKVKENKHKLFNYVFTEKGFDEQIDVLAAEMVR